MTKSRKLHFLSRFTAVYMLVAVVFSNFPLTALADTLLTVSATANGQANSLTLATSTDSFTIDLSSANATACQMMSPALSGVAVNTSMTVNPGHPYYPAIGGSVTFSFECTDGTNTGSSSVTVSLPSAPVVTPPASIVTIDVKANGSDGPVTLQSGDTFTYTWASTNATACEQTSPALTGVSTSGVSTSVTAGHPYYPSVGAPTTITIQCTDGTSTATDSVVLNLGTNGGGTTTPVTVDVKANGSDGPITITPGSSYTYTWTSSNATACEQTSPALTGVATSGVSTPVDPAHPYYPTASTPTTITIQCTDGTSTAIDSVVVNLGTSGGGGSPVVTVDVKANGSDGPVVIQNGTSYTYTWTSGNATACQQTSPAVTGVSVTGSSTPITPGHPYYPATSTPATITIQCTNGTSTAVDSVVVSLANGPTNPSCPVPTISSSLSTSVQINRPFSYTITINQGSTTPTITVSGLPSGLTYDASSHVISGTISQTGTFNILITSTDPCGTDSQTLVVTVTPGSGGGGGGGGSNPPPTPGGHHHDIPPGTPASCDFLKDYMRADFQNDPVEVIKLQTFLKTIEGYDYVAITGIYDQATINGVNAFQMQFKDDILTPWGHTAPTSYVYILTLKKINEIYCQHLLPLTPDEQNEINAFRALIQGLRDQGVSFESVTTPGRYVDVPVTRTESTTTISTTTPVEIPIVGQIDSQGQNAQNLAAAIFSLPDGFKAGMQCLYEWLLILIVLYILGSVLKDVLYKETPENVLKRFLAKWITISLGLVAAILIAYVLGEWCIILPLIIALIISLIWMALFPKHNSVRASTKSWYIVLGARARSIFSKKPASIIILPGEPKK
ncbi:MAG: hypothetical protein V4465_02760 [Patescibacteria group bacterium]